MTESTKEKIINTTYELMLTYDDISRITVRMIAAEAGVNVALVNYHFKNKYNLFDEVITKILLHAKACFRILDDDAKPIRQRLFDFLLQYQQNLVKHQKFIVYLLLSKQIYPTQMSYLQFVRSQGLFKIMDHITALNKERHPEASADVIRRQSKIMFSHLISILVFPIIYSASLPEGLKTMKEAFLSPEEAETSLTFFFDTYFPKTPA